MKTPASPNTTHPKPAKSEKSMPPRTPKEECEDVMNFLLPFVKKLLTEQGEFFPVGATMDVDGAIAAVATFDGDDHPASQTVIDSLLDVFRAGAKQRKYKATALMFDVRTVPPGESEKTDAVATRLDHVSGYSVVVLFPYHFTPAREVILAPPFATKGAADVFAN